MHETYYINGEAYVLRFRNGTHEVARGNEIVFRGWYEKCRAFLRDLEVAALEARF